MNALKGLLLSLSLVATGANAQEFYFRIGAGYAAPQAGQTMDGTGSPYNGSLAFSTYVQTYALKSASFTSGGQVVVGIGYLFNDHVGVQLDAFSGMANTKYSANYLNVQVGGVQSNVTVVQQAHTPTYLLPSLVVQTGGNPWNLYARMGLALPVSTSIMQDQIVSNAPGTGASSVGDATFKITNSFSLGLGAAVGVKYKLNGKTSVWAEASMLSSSLYIKQSELINYVQDGQSVPLSYVGGGQPVQYSKNVSVDSSQTRQPAYSQPFSNISFNVGVSFNLFGESRNSARHEEPGTRPRSGKFR